MIRRLICWLGGHALFIENSRGIRFLDECSCGIVRRNAPSTPSNKMIAR